jgi:hypothetical protein
MSATESVIARNWTEFFSATTSLAKRISLLQDGQMLAPVLRAQARSSFAAGASAKVLKVTILSPTQAQVSYTILVGGKPVLARQTGIAVYQDHTWKVGLASFCSLLALENGGKTTGLPAVCKAAT